MAAASCGETDQVGAGERQRSDSIKSMKLYNHVTRVYHYLVEHGHCRSVEEAAAPDAAFQLSKDELLDIPGLFLNYGQHDSVKDAIFALNLAGPNGDGKVVVDVGAGLGQPARAMAWLADGLRVIGVELQEDQVVVGNKLSRAVGLPAERCELLCADFLDETSAGSDLGLPGSGAIDGLVSWLCILHMNREQRAQVWQRSAKLLKPGAKIFVEDFFRAGEHFSPEELEQLRVDVYCDGAQLPSREEYVAELEAAGFTDIVFEDKSAEWGKFCAERLAAWEGKRAEIERIQNEATFADLSHFYRTIVSLWANGTLGGVRVIATKPTG